MSQEREVGEFRQGDNVEHPMWGAGVVLESRGMGPESRVVVSFPRVGTKRLLARYVTLVEDGGE